MESALRQVTQEQTSFKLTIAKDNSALSIRKFARTLVLIMIISVLVWIGVTVGQTYLSYRTNSIQNKIDQNKQKQYELDQEYNIVKVQLQNSAKKKGFIIPDDKNSLIIGK